MKDYRDIINNERPVSCQRVPMTIAHRAKQFAPFAALKGYEDAVERQEIIYDLDAVLSEEIQEEIDRKLHEIKAGDRVKVTYFEQVYGSDLGRGYYRIAEGVVQFFDKEDGRIRVEEMKLSFGMIRSITVDI